nr:peroxisomal biogenesis factor 19-like [Quercus suber]
MADKAKDVVETAPDPDEDDLDDLDDVLDEFNPTISSPKPTATSTKPTTVPAASGPGRPESKDASSSEPASEAELAAQLQQGMAGLMSELDSNPEMQAQFEQMMQELIAAGAAPNDKEAGQGVSAAAEASPKAEHGAKSTPEAKVKDGSASKTGGFDDTIRRTMERMQASDAAAASSSSAPQSEEALLEQMMRELAGGSGDGEEDFNKMLLNMMSQLTNKEILYEPMKELHDKFPAWLDKNVGELAKKGDEGRADVERFKGQQKVVGEIVARFERKGYSDDNEDDREYIVERMQKMQAFGSPPPDLVGDMSAAQEAFGDIDQGCPTQ